MKNIPCLLILLCIIIGCAASHMLVPSQKPNFSSGDKAILVIIRDQTTPTVVFKDYLDNKLIGETKGKMYFTTKVSPGPHYVIARGENVSVVRMNFKAGRVYYLHQDIWPAVVGSANAGISVMSEREASQAMTYCEYQEYDSRNPGEDLDPNKYERGIKYYNPGGHPKSPTCGHLKIPHPHAVFEI